MNILQLGMYNVVLTAGMNIDTLQSIGIAFIALILIISLVKNNSKSEDNEVNNTTVSIPGKSAANQGAFTEGVPSGTEQNLINDGELVAVITAAIMASVGDEVLADGLIVRSIRRVNRRRQSA